MLLLPTPEETGNFHYRRRYYSPTMPALVLRSSIQHLRVVRSRHTQKKVENA